jgi:hypothetical protein
LSSALGAPATLPKGIIKEFVLFLDCSVRLVGRVEYWVQKDIITIMPVFQDYQDIMTFNTITGLQTYRCKVMQISLPGLSGHHDHQHHHWSTDIQV